MRRNEAAFFGQYRIEGVILKLDCTRRIGSSINGMDSITLVANDAYYQAHFVDVFEVNKKCQDEVSLVVGSSIYEFLRQVEMSGLTFQSRSNPDIRLIPVSAGA